MYSLWPQGRVPSSAHAYIRTPKARGFSPEVRDRIIGGFIILCAVGVAWYERKWEEKTNPDHREDMEVKLTPDHSKDLSILADFHMDLVKLDLPYGIEFTYRADVQWNDFFLVTQWTPGPFMNHGVPGSEEVIQDDLKDILKPEKEEEEAREVILHEFGEWTQDVDCVSWN